MGLPGLTRAAADRRYTPKWQPSTAYTAGTAVLSPTGDVVTAKATFTSGTSYSAANWNASPAVLALQQSVGSDRFALLPDPFICAHRCGLNIFPEQTIEAASGCAALGVHILDFDANLLSDGGVGLCHDSTVDRTTSATGLTTAFSTMQWLNLQCDAGTWFAPAWRNDLRIPLLDDVLDRFGGKFLLSIEPKTTACRDAVIAAVVRRGMQKSVILNSTAAQAGPDAAAAHAAGIRYCAYLDATITRLQQAVDAGSDGIILQSGATAADIATAVATGVPIWAGQADRQVEWNGFRALGCKGLVTDDPIYSQNTHTKRTSDSWVTKTPGHGFISNLGTRPTFVGTDQIEVTAASNFMTLIGEVSPTSSALKTFTFEVQTVTPSSNTGDDVRILLGDDDGNLTLVGTPKNNGYSVLVRGNGQMFIYRSDKGVTYPLLASKTTGVVVPAAGDVRVLKVQVTATQIIFTDTTNALSVTATDSTYRPAGGWYVNLGKAGTTASGVWRFRALTLT